MPHSEAPHFFFLVAVLAVLGVVCHAGALYGWRTALRLMLPVLVFASIKEISLRQSPYQAGFQLMVPFGIPVWLISGWFITSLLAIDFSRCLARAVAPVRGNRLPWRLCVIGVFAALAAYALEPIGQLKGWWRWADVPFPRFASGEWGSIVAFQSALGLLIASRFSIRAFARTLGLVVALGVGLMVLGLLGWIPPVVLFAIVLVTVLVLLLQPWFDLRPELLAPAGEQKLSAWMRAIPSASMWMVLLLLLYYTVTSDRPDFWEYTLPILIVRASMDVHLLVRARRARVSPPAG